MDGSEPHFVDALKPREVLLPPGEADGPEFDPAKAKSVVPKLIRAKAPRRGASPKAEDGRSSRTAR